MELISFEGGKMELEGEVDARFRKFSKCAEDQPLNGASAHS